ncbi:MAG: DHA2 family efflux MFS transporter permease subunit [Actinomycetota bacterium]
MPDAPDGDPARTAPQPQGDDGRKWFVLAAVGSGIFLSTLSGSIVNVALPTLADEFDAEFEMVQWVVIAFLVTTAALLISMGRLGDTIGKKPVYLSGLGIFTFGSVLCALAPSLGWLIAFRMVQAIGAAMTQALGLAIATEAFPSEQRGLAVGYAGGLVSLGVVAGPTLGGALLGSLTWRWIFAINVPIGLVAVVLVFRFVPNRRPAHRTPFDVRGAALLVVALTAPLLALTRGQAQGFAEPIVLSLLVAGIAASAAFVVVELRSPHPLLSLELFRDPTFSSGLISGLFVFAALGGVLLLLPFYLEDMLGYSTVEVGLLIGLVPVLLAVIAPVAGAASDRWGTAPLTVGGLVVMMAGLIIMGRLTLDTTTLGFVLIVLPYAAGLGLFQSPNNSAILGAVDRDALGAASGLLSVTRNLGTTIGTAVVGATWTARVAARGDRPTGQGPTDAPLGDQVAGLQDTLVIVALALTLPIVIAVAVRQRPSSDQR